MKVSNSMKKIILILAIVCLIAMVVFCCLAAAFGQENSVDDISAVATARTVLSIVLSIIFGLGGIGLSVILSLIYYGQRKTITKTSEVRGVVGNSSNNNAVDDMPIEDMPIKDISDNVLVEDNTNQTY